MLVQHCPCGQKYKFPDTAAGKRAKCKKCGVVFTIEAAPESPAPSDDIGLFDEIAEAAQRAKAAKIAARPSRPAEPDGLDDDYARTAPAPKGAVEGVATKRTYFQDLMWAFLFPANPGNLATFVAIWLVMSLMPFMPCILITLIIIGWYSAFRFSVVEAGAAGEDELPSVIVTGGFFDEIIEPVLKWVACSAVVLIPALVYMVYAVIRQTFNPQDVVPALAGGFGGLFNISDELTVFALLVLAGLFFWPMMVLCVAVGGLETMVRVDLMARSIVKTFPPYLLTVAIVFATEWAGMALSDVVANRLMTSAATSPSIGDRLSAVGILSLVTMLVTVYLEIVSLKVIGLYYHHFKKRFAWDWG